MQASAQWFVEKFASEGTSFGLLLQEKLHSEQTQYQTIDIYQTQTFGRLMALDGCVMVTDRDHYFYHEVMSHGALLRHPNPKTVAIIGGGDCGTLAQVLKHEDIECVYQVELDERVTRVSEEFFPELTSSNQDARARFLFEDGAAWIKSVAPGSLDVLIIDSTDPVGPAQVLFSEPFLADCFKALSDNGILIQQSESPLLHTESVIVPLRESLKTVGFSTLKTLQFPQPAYPSGWWSATLGCKGTMVDRAEAAIFDQLALMYLNQETYNATGALPAFMEKALNNNSVKK